MQEKLYGNLRFFRLSWTLDRTAHAFLSHSSKNALKKVHTETVTISMCTPKF